LTQVSSIREDAIGVVEPVWTSAQLGSTATVPPAPFPSQGTLSLSCNSKLAVGVDVRAGIYVDAIALRCADLGPAGEHSNAVTTAFFGGDGGSRVNLRCNTGEVLTRVAVRYGLYVDRVTIGCRPWRRDSGTGGSTRTVGSAGGPGGDRGATADCPRPLSVRGFQNLYTRNELVAAFEAVCTVPPGL